MKHKFENMVKSLISDRKSCPARATSVPFIYKVKYSLCTKESTGKLLVRKCHYGASNLQK